jgi:DNA (cytosine-5)-methyltransferase 1
VEWDCFAAMSIGAPHLRDRLWILAYAAGSGNLRLPVRPWRPHQASAVAVGRRENVADDDRAGCSDAQGERPDAEPSGETESRTGGWWNAEPAVGRVAHGVADRVERLRALGNGQVPAVAARAWCELMARVS